jgi:general stress protein 26
MTLAKISEFVGRQLLAIEASNGEAGQPQAAVIGIVSNAPLELFFDTLTSSRKCANLRRDPRITLVVGWDLAEACTAQIEGVADEPTGDELARWKELYFARFPDGIDRERWPDITYFRVQPRWVRFSDFRGAEPAIEELDLSTPG